MLNLNLPELNKQEKQHAEAMTLFRSWTSSWRTEATS